MNEKKWTRLVVDTAHLYGWMVVHYLPAIVKSGRKWRTPYQGDGKGWPDLFLLHPRRKRIAVAELKTDAGRLTGSQKRWLELFALCGVEAFVWRPRMWAEVLSYLSFGEADHEPSR